MRAAAGFRMELDAEGWDVGIGDAFAGVVVYVGKALFCEGWKRTGFYGVAVVLAGYVDAAGFCVFARVVAAAVTVFKFTGFAATGEREHLVAKADSEDWDFSVVAEFFDFCYYAGIFCWVSWTIAEHDSVWI